MYPNKSPDQTDVIHLGLLVIVNKTKCRKKDVRLPGKGNSSSHRARPVHFIITLMKWIQTTRLPIKKSLSLLAWDMARAGPARLSINNLLASHNLPPNPVRDTGIYDTNARFWATRPVTQSNLQVLRAVFLSGLI